MSRSQPTADPRNSETRVRNPHASRVPAGTFHFPKTRQVCGFRFIIPRNATPNKGEAMPRYVDGFVIPIHKSKLVAYRAMAAKAGKIWKEHGALEYVEAIGDDLKIKGMVMTFPKMAAIKPRETVLFSFIVYKSRRHRDAVNKKVMADPRLQAMMDPKHSPFDFKRMAYGGFKTLVDM
jgi:uncharacterized protein YbaA (DUF1428 family)